MEPRNTTTSFALAVVTILTAIFLYDVMGAIIKHLSQTYPTAQLAMFRNLFGLIPTVLILLWSQNWIEAGRPLVIRQWRLAILRGGIGAFAQISFYLAVHYLEFATATAIVFAGPMFVTLLSIPILGHSVGKWRWLAVLTGFAGVLLVVRPGVESFTWYALLPVMAALGFATTSVTSKLFDKEVPTALINIYYTTGSLTAAVAILLFTGGYTSVAAWQDWAFIIAMGFAGGVAAFCIIAAYRLTEPSKLSPFEYFGIPFSFMLGWVFFNEAPFDRLIPGVFLIVGGGMLIIWRERVGK